MVISFEINSGTEDSYRIILSSGEDAFFAQPDIIKELGNEVELVEIDLERTRGNNPTSIQTLYKIAEGIAKLFQQNEKAILYYYCDDLAEIPYVGSKHSSMWPQEYRSELFGRMFQRQVQLLSIQDELQDITVVIHQGDRPLYVHIIARKIHTQYIDVVKKYLTDNYGK